MAFPLPSRYHGGIRGRGIRHAVAVGTARGGLGGGDPARKAPHPPGGGGGLPGWTIPGSNGGEPLRLLVQPQASGGTDRGASGSLPGDRHPQRRPDLEPDADPATLKEELESLGGEVLWVSHLPLLPRLASLLLTGREDRLGFLWEPGGVLALRREGRGGWRQERFTPPDGMEP